MTTEIKTSADVVVRATTNNNKERFSEYYESVKKWQEACNREKEINPSTDPEEALGRIKVLAELGSVTTENKLVLEAYNEMLIRSGRNPNEWIRHPFAKQPTDINEGFTHRDMDKILSRYPSGLEFFVLQGEPFSKQKMLGEGEGTNYGMLQNWWVAYVRKRPMTSQIETS